MEGFRRGVRARAKKSFIKSLCIWNDRDMWEVQIFIFTIKKYYLPVRIFFNNRQSIVIKLKKIIYTLLGCKEIKDAQKILWDVVDRSLTPFVKKKIIKNPSLRYNRINFNVYLYFYVYPKVNVYPDKIY